MNRTLHGMVRCMLDQAGLPDSYWAEAVRTAAYIKNRLPTKALKELIPFEFWSGKEPKIDHFRIFGCVAFAHTPSAKRVTKLDQRGVECLFLGYCPNMKAYRLIEKGANKIRNTRNVIFDEGMVLKSCVIDTRPSEVIHLSAKEDEIPIPNSYAEVMNSDHKNE